MAKDVYELHVVKRGEGRPVILLHGIMSTHRYWNDVAARLESRRKLYLPDLLGFGASPKPRNAPYSLDQYVDCLDHTFRNYRFPEPPVLVGSSMGAVIALRWSVRHPGKFSGLVLCSPVFFERERFHQQMATIALEGRLLRNHAVARAVTAGLGMATFVPTRFAPKLTKKGRWPLHVIEDATLYPYYVYRRILRSRHFMDEVLAELRQVSIPTRILIGAKDPTASHALDELEEICRINPDCQVSMLPTGHQIPIDDPVTPAEAILSL